MCSQHRCPLIALAIRLDRPSHLTGPIDCIRCPYRAVVDKFYLVVQH